jgi:hypothetical protein
MPSSSLFTGHPTDFVSAQGNAESTLEPRAAGVLVKYCTNINSGGSCQTVPELASSFACTNVPSGYNDNISSLVVNDGYACCFYL